MILSVISQKGGVGKTTTALTIAAGLAMTKTKKRVLLVDLDAQCNLSLTEGVLNNPLTINDVLTGNANVLDVIIPSARYDVIAGSEALATLELNDPNVIKNALNPAAQQYDYIVLDTPPHLGLMTINALVASNAAIIIVQADLYSLQSLAQLTDTINAVKAAKNPDLNVLGILINRFYSRATYSKTFAEHITNTANELQTSIFKTPIRESIVVKEALANQKSIFDYAPKASQTADYVALINDILKRVKQHGNKQK